MLGRTIADPHGLEGSPGTELAGLGLLPAASVLRPAKRLARADGIHLTSGRPVGGYEIHHGETAACTARSALSLAGPDRQHHLDGAVSANGKIWGTYLHGIFDGDPFRRWFIDTLRARAGLARLDRVVHTYDLEPALDRDGASARELLESIQGDDPLRDDVAAALRLAATPAATTRRLLRTFEEHLSFVTSVALGPEGRHALSGSNDTTLKLWEVSSGNQIRTLRGHSKGVRGVTFSSDGNLIVAGFVDGAVLMWEAHNERLLRVLSGHTDWVKSVVFSSDDRLLASGSLDNTMRLWEVPSGRSLQKL